MTTLSLGSRSLSVRQAVDLLTTHLDAIVQVEFFTIPVYLTGVYSFSREAVYYVDPTPAPGQPVQPLYDMQQNALSVAVQEMYHLQLASNLCNALRPGGPPPDIPQLSLASDQPTPIPHLCNADGTSVMLPGLGSLPALLDTMIRIEAPDPSGTYPEPNDSATYQSISDLYHATAQLIGLVAQAALAAPDAEDAPPFDGGKQVSYGTFTSTYTWNTIPQGSTGGPESAVKAINAITDQGEGRDVLQSPVVQKLLGMLVKSGGDGDVHQEFQPKANTRFSAYGMYTHETRFEQLKAALSTPDYQRWQADVKAKYQAEGYDNLDVFYPGDGVPITIELPTPPPAAAQVQNAINVLWSCLVDSLISGFSSGKLSDTYTGSGSEGIATFNDVMMVFKYGLPLLWTTGSVPSYAYSSGTQPQDVKAAFDVADPFYLAHWDAKTAALRADPSFPRNSCQGLNTCAGFGWGGMGTQPGDGACATADLHSCGGGNNCTSQGGCGFLSWSADGSTLLPPEQQWIPGLNQCKNLGGCQTPVGAQQVFSSDGKKTIDAQTKWTQAQRDALDALAGTNVWERARTLRGFSTTPPPPADPSYDGLKRRQSVEPTSAE